MKNPFTHFHRLGRKHIVPLAVVLSLGSILVIGVDVSGAMAGFTASIDNNGNSAGTGSVLMTESSGGVTCYSNGASANSSVSTNANNCSINKLGGNLAMLPGTTSNVNVTFTNSGTLPVNTAFTLTPSGCIQSANGTPIGSDIGFCGVVDVAIWDSTDNKCIVPISAGIVQANCIPLPLDTLALLGTTPINLKALTGAIAAGGSRTFTISTEIDAANATNADMDLQVSDNLTWTFTA